MYRKNKGPHLADDKVAEVVDAHAEEGGGDEKVRRVGHGLKRPHGLEPRAAFAAPRGAAPRGGLEGTGVVVLVEAAATAGRGDVEGARELDKEGQGAEAEGRHRRQKVLALEHAAPPISRGVKGGVDGRGGRAQERAHVQIKGSGGAKHVGSTPPPLSNPMRRWSHLKLWLTKSSWVITSRPDSHTSAARASTRPGTDSWGVLVVVRAVPEAMTSTDRATGRVGLSTLKAVKRASSVTGVKALSIWMKPTSR